MDICCHAPGARICAMIKRLRQFNPDKDDYVAFVEPLTPERDQGRDIDATVHHSRKHGFYLRKRIVQIRKGRVWMTASRDEEAEKMIAEQRRCLSTIRPLSRPETIRLILETYLPEQQGIRTSVMKTLSDAGIV
jgi:hypothetical protein